MSDLPSILTMRIDARPFICLDARHPSPLSSPRKSSSYTTTTSSSPNKSTTPTKRSVSSSGAASTVLQQIRFNNSTGIQLQLSPPSKSPNTQNFSTSTPSSCENDSTIRSPTTQNDSIDTMGFSDDEVSFNTTYDQDKEDIEIDGSWPRHSGDYRQYESADSGGGGGGRRSNDTYHQRNSRNSLNSDRYSQSGRYEKNSPHTSSYNHLLADMDAIEISRQGDDENLVEGDKKAKLQLTPEQLQLKRDLMKALSANTGALQQLNNLENNVNGMREWLKENHPEALENFNRCFPPQ